MPLQVAPGHPGGSGHTVIVSPSLLIVVYIQNKNFNFLQEVVEQLLANVLYEILCLQQTWGLKYNNEIDK